MKEPPDILNSKIKKLRIELPHYTFSHSSSGDSPHDFIGRERIRERIKKVVEDSPDEPGVYLIAGNRGVGKTSLISWVINETSLKAKSSFNENFRYVVLLLLAVVGTQFCLQSLNIPEKCCIIFGIVSFLFSFIILCCFNSYRRKFPEKARGFLRKIWNSIASAFKELSYLINMDNPYGKSQYLLKIILIVCITQIFSIIPYITPTIAVFIYLIVVFGYNVLFKNKQRNKKENIFFLSIWKYIKNHSRLYLRINFGHKLRDEKDILRLITRTLSTEYNKYCRSFLRMLLRRIIAFGFLFLFAFLFSPIIKNQEFYKKLIKGSRLYEASSQILLDDNISLKELGINLFIKNNMYYYQKNETLKKLDIKNKIHADIIKNIYIEKDIERLSNIFSEEKKQKYIKIKKIIDSNDELVNKHIWFKNKINTKVGKLGNFFLILDQLVYETIKIIKKAPNFLLFKQEKKYEKIYIPPIDYLFWLSFFLMYLLCKLLSRCTWITNFYVTHQIIKQRLKRLNNDITHSTERENSINLNSGNVGPEIGTKIKKSRNVADTREIEKELQDILDDMQRIPIIMCRPNIVIVFDELDKVEPGDSGLEKDNSQTKASLFSLHATRERQTEILRILSNMKYFLSTAKAKFIFIAGREMFDIHLADVSERNNYIGSIFNVVILVPSFLTDHHTVIKSILQESSIASLPEEFVCRRLFPHDYKVESYNLQSYREYLKCVIYKKEKRIKEEEIEKIIAVLQQFIIYLAHVSKGAPKKMIQLFESHIEIRTNKDDAKNTLLVQRYHSSRHFLSFNYYKQYTLGIVAYLITPIFYRLAESNIKEHSDKLLVSSLRFVDFLFKFHKNSFSWKHLDMSPEMLEVNRAPELKSVAVELLNYLTQVHINKSNFSLSDYKFDGLIANEIFAMAKTDEVFSALFSFSLDEILPLKKHYQDLLAKKENEYKKKKKTSEYIDAISSLQGVLGDIYYYDDGLEEAEAYYKSTVQAFRKNKDDKKMKLDQLYVYARNMLRLGIIYEKRKQYDFAYMTYGELCKRIIRRRNITYATSSTLNFKNIPPHKYNMLFKKMTYEGLKILYLPFIAKLQILEKSHIGGITSNHLEQLDDEFNFLTHIIAHEEANILEAEFFSRIADILYYKNSDLKCKKGKDRINDNDENEQSGNKKNFPVNCSCTACYYYHKALSILLGKPYFDISKNKDANTVKNLLRESVEQLKENYNVKYCTVLARILSDWGNVFFSCDICNANKNKEYNTEKNKCYICDKNDYNLILKENSNKILGNCIEYLESEKENTLYLEIEQLETKKDIAFSMYSISSKAYRKVDLYKRSSYQIYKILYLFKYYEQNNEDYIIKLSKKAIHYLWYANDDLNVPELNKRKKDLGKKTIKERMSLKNLLVDTEITRIRILVKELGLKQDLTSGKLNEYYRLYITSPYRINYSIVARIYRLRLKSKVNYKAYKKILENVKIKNDIRKKDFILVDDDYDNIFNDGECIEISHNIFGKKLDIKEIFENLIADSIYCLTDIAQLLETMEETYLFPHSFLGSIHEHLSFWIRQYEAYEVYKKENPQLINDSQIDELLDQYLGEEWREQLSGYRENQRALSHYYKCLEMHKEGRAYQNMLDIMVYVKDDFNDRSDHFNIAEERHLIVNGEIDKKINELKDIYKESRLHDVDNYFNDIHH